MKFLGKTKDGAIDGLLRAYLSRSASLPHACPDFDPDLANAYLERSLTAESQLRYEQHLADCGACRKSVVALARLAAPDGAPSIASPRGQARSGWLTRLVRPVSRLSAPQWAMAAAAIIVLVISLPLILSRNQLRIGQDASKTAQVDQESDTRSVDRSAESSSRPAVEKSGAELAQTTPKQSEKREAEVVDGNRPATSQPAAAGNVSGGMRADGGKGKTAARPADELQARADRPASESATGDQAAPEALAKSESDQKRQQNEKDSGQPSPPGAAGTVEEGAGKEVARRAEEPPPPPSPRTSAEPARSRKGLKQPSALALRDSATGEAVRPPEKEIRGKKFSLQDGVWTDKDYNPDKNLPIVNIVRDSNVYKEVLAKQAGLKPFLDLFREHERAIIVYKGKVYKLIPQ